MKTTNLILDSFEVILIKNIIKEWSNRITQYWLGIINKVYKHLK